MATRKTTKKTTSKKSVKAVAPESKSAPIEEKKSRKLFTKKFLIFLLVLAVLGVLGYLFKSYFLAARVNGEIITRLSVIQQLEKQKGKEVLEGMVTKALILQEMKKKGITVTDEEVNQEIKKIETSLTQQGRTLPEALAEQGLSRNELFEQLKIQKMIEKLFSKDAVVSEKEVDEYIEKNKDALPQDQDPKVLRTTIKDQLKQQKLTTKFQTWLEDLQKKAKTDYYVTY